MSDRPSSSSHADSMSRATDAPAAESSCTDSALATFYQFSMLWCCASWSAQALPAGPCEECCLWHAAPGPRVATSQLQAALWPGVATVATPGSQKPDACLGCHGCWRPATWLRYFCPSGLGQRPPLPEERGARKRGGRCRSVGCKRCRVASPAAALANAHKFACTQVQ